MTTLNNLPYREQCLVLHGYWAGRAVASRTQNPEFARYAAHEARRLFALATNKDS